MRDVEAHVRALLDVALDDFSADLDDSRYDDLLSFLLATCWELSLRFEPDRGITFSTYSRTILSRRIVDWYRKTFSDTRYGRYMDAATGKRVASREVTQATGEPCRSSRSCVLGVDHDGGCIVRIAHPSDEVSLDAGVPSGEQEHDDPDRLPTVGPKGAVTKLTVPAVDDDDFLTTLTLGWKSNDEAAAAC